MIGNKRYGVVSTTCPDWRPILFYNIVYALNTLPNIPAVARGRSLSGEGRARLLSVWGEPLFLADWVRVLFLHFEVDAVRLQRDVPFPLDLRDGRAYVSLVAFTMRGMRFRVGGKKLAWLLRPIATHEFLNVRTYVSHGGEPGIYFLTEWLSNWLSVQLGPLLYGLPYRYAKIRYDHPHEQRHEGTPLVGSVQDVKRGGRLEYRARFADDQESRPVEGASLDEFLMERYTAYTACGSTRRLFRIWHPTWLQSRVEVEISEMSLLEETWPWFGGARLVGANYAPGFRDVWMGRAHGIIPKDEARNPKEVRKPKSVAGGGC